MEAATLSSDLRPTYSFLLGAARSSSTHDRGFSTRPEGKQLFKSLFPFRRSWFLPLVCRFLPLGFHRGSSAEDSLPMSSRFSSVGLIQRFRSASQMHSLKARLPFGRPRCRHIAEVSSASNSPSPSSTFHLLFLFSPHNTQTLFCLAVGVDDGQPALDNHACERLAIFLAHSTDFP